MLNLDECRTGAEKRQHSVADSDVTARQQRKAHWAATDGSAIEDRPIDVVLAW